VLRCSQERLSEGGRGREVPAGTYTVVDSDPQTWSTNERANGLGLVTVLGTYDK
jgi:hypothetical protein